MVQGPENGERGLPNAEDSLTPTPQLGGISMMSKLGI